MFISKAFTEQGSNMSVSLIRGILVIVCSTDVWDSRKLTMHRGVKDRLVRNAVLIPECGI